MKPVKLQDVIEKLDLVDENIRTYYSKETGSMLSLSVDELRIAEDSEDDDDFSGYPGWQRELIRDAIDVIENEDGYIELPDRDEINEYGIMEDFCLSVRDERIREDMCSFIRGKGAFRRFKDKIFHYDLEKEWYSFRDNALRQIAIAWCEENEVVYFERVVAGREAI